jgi:hypothetical protein
MVFPRALPARRGPLNLGEVSKSDSTRVSSCDAPTMLRIEKLLGKTVLKVSGRLQEVHLSELQTEIEQCADSPRLDLKDVTLLDRPSVRFLIQCESQGVQLVNCPLFIQEWMTRERCRAAPPPKSW